MGHLTGKSNRMICEKNPIGTWSCGAEDIARNSGEESKTDTIFKQLVYKWQPFRNYQTTLT